jgi:hypothetical protein
MPCHDPCLDPCDRRNDCCCFQLGLKSTVQRGSVPGLASCIAIQSLTLTWATPLPECVRARAGVDTDAEVVLEVYLAGVGETPDATATADVGELVITREELFGSGEPCGACLSDLSLDMWLVVRNGDGHEVMRCPVCPASCDEGSPSVSPSPSPPNNPYACELDVFAVYAATDLPGYVSPADMGLNGATFDGVFSFDVTATVQVFNATPEDTGKIRIYIETDPGHIYNIPPGPGGSGGGSHYVDTFIGTSAEGGDSPVAGDGEVTFTYGVVLPYVPDQVTIRVFYIIPPDTAASCVCPVRGFPQLRCNDGTDDRSVWKEVFTITL